MNAPPSLAHLAALQGDRELPLVRGRSRKERYEVHVYRPSGMRFCILDFECTTAAVAVRRAKKRVYQMHCLAHFYKFVAKLAPAKVTGEGAK